MLAIDTINIGDRYKITKRISQKAGRSTYLALDTHSDKLVIIKILQFNDLFQWDDLKLFEREAKTLKNLDHTAIPEYLDYFEIDNEQIRGFALVQTYIDAPSLAEVVEQGRKFTEEELIELAQKLLKILNYLHHQIPPVIHRDIKPSNILISNRSGNSVGDIYLVDFGSVQTVASKGEGTITIVGSYGYIPLEQFGGYTTTASDIYSLGMTLIYLITGVHPAELPQNDGRVEFKDSQISNRLRYWLVKMVEPYLDKRFDSVDSALTSLSNKDQENLEKFLNLKPQKNLEKFLNLKPCNSKIKLYRDRNKLTVVFQQEIIEHRLNPNPDWPLIYILFVIFTFTLLFGGLIYFLYLICAVLIWIFIKSIYQSINNHYPIHYEKLSINKDRTIKYTGSKEWNSIYPNDRVNLIVYNPGYCNSVSNIKSRVKFENVRISHQLSLHADEKKEYVIGNYGESKAELYWLGKEISNFIGLELLLH